MAEIKAIIFDVDGVLIASPHERAWREALAEIMATEWQDIATAVGYQPDRFGTAVYQELVAGKPRLDGARSVLEYFGVPKPEQRAAEYAERKQRRLEALIEAGAFVAFADAVQFAVSLKALGFRLAAASSSKNANRLMHLVDLGGFGPWPIGTGSTLLDLFDANVCGRDLPQGKPHPAIFLVAAAELGLEPPVCLVVEDAPSGVQAARAAGMRALGVARAAGDELLLESAGANLVVERLDQVAVEGLAEGRLERK